MVVGARRAGLSISQTADLLGFSHTTISRVYREWSGKEKISSERQLCGWKCLVDVRGQRRMGRLVRDDRKATVTQITTHYNQGMKNTISEHTTRRTLKQMDSSSRRPHRVPLLSDKNSTRRIQFTQTHQNWTRFLLRHSDVGSEFGVKNMKAWIILSCLNGSGWWWWCNGVGDIFLAHFGPFSTNWASFNTTAFLSIVADHVHPFMTTVYHLLMYFQLDNAACHKAQIISDWFLEHDNEFTLLKRPPQSPDLNPIEHYGMWWDGRFTSWMCSRQICSNFVMLSCQYGPKSLRNVSNTLLNLCHEELRQFWRQPGTSKVASECIL